MIGLEHPTGDRLLGLLFFDQQQEDMPDGEGTIPARGAAEQHVLLSKHQLAEPHHGFHQAIEAALGFEHVQP